MAKTPLHRSGQHGDDAQLSERAGGSNGGTAEPCEVVAVGASDTFDDSERAEATQLTGQGCRGEIGQQADQIGTAHAVDVELGPLQSAQQQLLGALEEVVSSPEFVGQLWLG